MCPVRDSEINHENTKSSFRVLHLFLKLPNLRQTCEPHVLQTAIVTGQSRRTVLSSRLEEDWSFMSLPLPQPRLRAHGQSKGSNQQAYQVHGEIRGTRMKLTATGSLPRISVAYTLYMLIPLISAHQNSLCGLGAAVSLYTNQSSVLTSTRRN